MPLTDFQREVLAVIVANRSEASHFAGGLVLNAAADSPRFSKDFDFFHDAVESLAESCARDVAALRAAGYEVVPNEKFGPWDRPSSFRRAEVSRGAGQVTLDWAHDSDWRFFPIIRDSVEMKMEWIEMCDRAEAEIIRLADTLPDTPIGVVFVDSRGEPGWLCRDPALRVHHPSRGGSWP